MIKKKIIFTGIGYNLLETIKYFLNYKQVEVSAVIPLNNYPNSKKFYQNLKKLQKQSFFKILIFDQINSLNCVNKLKKISPDLICNWGHNQLFKKKILDIPKIGCLNIHPGLLPYGRGSGAVQGEIINRNKQIGWSTHFMDENFDKGNLVNQKRIKLGKKIPYLNEITSKLLHNADKFYISSIKKVLMKKKIKNKKLSFGRYYPKFVDGDEFIDWNQNSDYILRKIRSRSPERFSIAYLSVKKKRYFVSKVNKSNIKNYNFVNGQVIAKDKKKGNLIKTNDNAIWISSGSFDKKRFSVPNFRIGTVFYTNTVGNNLILLERINKLEKKLKKNNL